MSKQPRVKAAAIIELHHSCPGTCIAPPAGISRTLAAPLLRADLRGARVVGRWARCLRIVAVSETDLPTAPVLVPLAHCLGLSLPPRTPSTQTSATATNRAFEMRDIRGLCRNSPGQSLSSGENDSSRLVRLPISALLTNDANADVVACRGRCWRLSRYGDAAHEMRELLADRAALRLTGVRLRGRGGAERVDFVCEHLGQCCESS